MKTVQELHQMADAKIENYKISYNDIKAWIRLAGSTLDLVILLIRRTRATGKRDILMHTFDTI